MIGYIHKRNVKLGLLTLALISLLLYARSLLRRDHDVTSATFNPCPSFTFSTIPRADRDQPATRGTGISDDLPLSAPSHSVMNATGRIMNYSTALHTKIQYGEIEPHNKNLTAMIKESSDIFELLPKYNFTPNYKSFCWTDKRKVFRCLPGAYIAGMPKCGTTDLFSKLEWHEDIIKPPAGKENMYWARSRLGRPIGLTVTGSRPKETFDSFTRRMTPGDMQDKHDGVILDGTPVLLSEHRGWEGRYPRVRYPPYTNADLIHTVSPDALIIAMVREPAERLWSDYLYFDRGETRTRHSFRGDVASEIGRFNVCLESRDLRRCCFGSDNSLRVQLSLGVYICFLQDWKENFGDNLLVITLKEYGERKLQTLKKVYDFLGVRVKEKDLSLFLETSATQNVRHDKDLSKGDMLNETRTVLQEFYRPFNAQLAKYFQDSKFLFEN